MTESKGKILSLFSGERSDVFKERAILSRHGKSLRWRCFPERVKAFPSRKLRSREGCVAGSVISTQMNQRPLFPSSKDLP